MTNLLTKAFEEASKLPAPLQDELAAELIEDIRAELLWDSTFEKTGDALERMAEKAKDDVRSGRTKKLGIDEI